MRYGARYKLGSVKVKLEDAGVQAVLKHSQVADDLEEYAKKIAQELDVTAPADKKWQVAISRTKTRLIAKVYNTDETVRFKERKTGVIAKHMASKKFKGRR